ATRAAKDATIGSMRHSRQDRTEHWMNRDLTASTSFGGLFFNSGCSGVAVIAQRQINIDLIFQF
ncbi:MAG TPA: hypothetical protein VG722_09115, partial [Tepidisphaeraceae bacterium]|nr:hypothetical protein [Tepidisphaeraceae bacterium]